MTGDMLERVLSSAQSPVVILWEETDSIGYRSNRVAMEFAADQYDEKIIFVSVLIDENPECAACFGIVPEGSRDPQPGANVYHKCRWRGTILNPIFSCDQAVYACATTLSRAEEAP